MTDKSIQPRQTVDSELASSRTFSETLKPRANAQILESLPGLACICVDGIICNINRSGFFLLGGAPGRTMMGLTFQSFLTDEYAAIVDDILQMVADEKRPMSLRIMCLDNTTISVRLSVSPIPEISDTAYLITGQDITQQVEMTEGLIHSEQRFRKLVDSAQNLICVCENGVISYINVAGTMLLKEPKAGAISGRALEDFLHPDYRDFLFLDIDDLFDTHELIPARMVDTQGLHIDVNLSFTLLERLADGGCRYMAEARDITAQNRAVSALRNSIETLEHRVEERTRELQEEVTVRRSAEEKMRHMASHDELTKLPNRALLMDRLDVALRRAHREKSLCAVIFIDLDGFKAVNDTMGHEAGDLLLQAVAAILLKCTRETDTVARLGGDEFVLVLPDLMSNEDAKMVANLVLDSLSGPIELAGSEARIGASIGIALYPEHGEQADKLLKAADGAMYKVKGKGKNAFAIA